MLFCALTLPYCVSLQFYSLTNASKASTNYHLERYLQEIELLLKGNILGKLIKLILQQSSGWLF
jgi:hypothetical protein